MKPGSIKFGIMLLTCEMPECSKCGGTHYEEIYTSVTFRPLAEGGCITEKALECRTCGTRVPREKK